MARQAPITALNARRQRPVSAQPKLCAVADPPAPSSPHQAAIARARSLIAAQRLTEAAGLLQPVLDSHADSHPAMAAAAELIKGYEAYLGQLPPLLHTERLALRIDERGPVLFHELLTLLHRQDAQIRELHNTLAELI